MTDAAAWHLSGATRGVEDHISAATARKVFDQYVPFVWRTLQCQGIGPSDLEDVTQEVFVVIFRKLPQYEERGVLFGWIYRICVRAASTHRRRAAVRHEVLVDELPEEEPTATLDGDVERFHASEQLMALLATLDEEKRAVFALHEIEQFSIPEVATILDCPAGTAYSRLAAARKHLVDRLTEQMRDQE